MNEEHRQLMKDYFFEIMQVDTNTDLSLAELIQSAKNVLTKNIKKITNLVSSETSLEISITATAILDSENARKDVLMSFGALVQRVSQQYLIDDWSEDGKQLEKQELFTAIIDIFAEFKELLSTDNPIIRQFVNDLIKMSLKGITETVGQQHRNLEDELNRLQTTTNTNLKSFVTNLVFLVNRDESLQEHDNLLISEIIDSHDFAKLENFPIKIKIAYLYERLQAKLAALEVEGNIVDQLAENFEEQYGDSLEEFAQSDRTRKAGGLTVVSSPKGCRRLVQTNFKNYLSHQHRSFYRAAPDFEYIP
ncbi:MAG: hypothetical protein ACRCXC_09180 [Legionella sp.]